MTKSFDSDLKKNLNLKFNSSACVTLFCPNFTANELNLMFQNYLKIIIGKVLPVFLTINFG